MHLHLYDVTDITLTKDVHGGAGTHVIRIVARSEGKNAVITLFFDKEHKDVWNVIGQLVEQDYA
tara:strand:+ start:2101 stop:2292 length:192 start_codon:yes stop_codon:yes gene_type:complete